MERSTVAPLWVVIALCSVQGACGARGEKREAKPVAVAPASSTTTETEAEPVPVPEAAPAAPAVLALPPAPESPGEAAYAHFDAAGRASRAILAADLPGAAPHLAWLAHHQYPDKLPPPWRPHATRLQLAARVLARASTVGEALQALPTLHAACGSCHAAIADIDFNATEPPIAHADGTQALLQGLSGEADAVYLHALWAAPRVADKKADAAALKALKTTCERGRRATTWVERQTITQELFTTCGSCHDQYR